MVQEMKKATSLNGLRRSPLFHLNQPLSQCVAGEPAAKISLKDPVSQTNGTGSFNDPVSDMRSSGKPAFVL